MSQKQSVATSTIVLMGANILASLLAVVRGSYVAFVLSPAEMGIWSLVLALLTYVNYADLGTNAGMILEVPKLVGQKNMEAADRVRRQVYLVAPVVSGAVALPMIVAAFTFLAGTQWSTIALITPAATLIFGLLNYYNLAVRLQERFVLIGVSTVIISAVPLAVFIAVHRVIGDLSVASVGTGWLAGAATAVLLLGIAARMPLPRRIEWSLVGRLMKIGLPVSLLPIGFTLFQSVDRWVVASRVPVEDMGYYGFGAMIGMFLYMLPTALAYVLFTRQIERFGATGDARRSESLVLGPLLSSSYGMAVLAGGVMLAVPFALAYVFPAYLPGTRTTVLLVLGNCLLFAAPVAGNFLVSAGRQRHLFVTLGGVLAMKAALAFVLVRTAWQIEGAALAVLASDVAYGGLLTFWAMRLLGGTLRSQLVRVAMCFVPFAVCLSIAGLLWNETVEGGEFWADLVDLLARGSLFLAIAGPLLLFAAWRSGLSAPPALAHVWQGVYARRAGRG